ncbi:hypothetical protein B0J12DRAFT_773250 [Macrophomina phaseolina]|uniref:Uncharacterized protein n=1 Tax=Macrophomina phaseolina TaxID=35725 RepID=A0ABQ8FSY7_9PEZI|nr:hypothetical protein B0J12DRAFT_773250 [Macrophomina phaseolina]
MAASTFVCVYSKAYLKGCTIYTKRQKSTITAHSMCLPQPPLQIQPGGWKSSTVPDPVTRRATPRHVPLFGYCTLLASDKESATKADGSASDSTTVYSTGNFLQEYRTNSRNAFGKSNNYAEAERGVKSSKYASLYGCHDWGNQDLLPISDYFVAFSSLIIGIIDMIWGSDAGYFLNSTISPKTDDISLTAIKRATKTASCFRIRPVPPASVPPPRLASDARGISLPASLTA